MTNPKFTKRVAAFYLMAALFLPTFQPAFGASPGRITDVGLSSAGRLVGQLVDSQGNPVVDSTIEIAKIGEKPAAAKTNARGYFAVDNLQAGVYVASAPGTATMVRVWAPRTAPPSASDGLLLVQPENTVRAQNGGQFLQAHWVKLLVAGGIVGVIVAVVANKNAS